MSANCAWLDNLKPGDPVIVKVPNSVPRVDTVKRRTANYIILANPWREGAELRFRAKDGEEPGDFGYHGRPRLIEPTGELICKIKRAGNLATLKNLVGTREVGNYLTDGELAEVLRYLRTAETRSNDKLQAELKAREL